MNNEIITDIANDEPEAVEATAEDIFEEETEQELVPDEEGAKDAALSAEELLKAELESLRSQVGELTSLLEKKQEEADRIATQIGDFYALFPSTSIETLPEEVWDDVKSGNSLAASYAIYQRKLALKAEQARKVNEKNAKLSAGKAGCDNASEYFTPSEVRAMSQEQVRANYSKIIRSMQKWN